MSVVRVEVNPHPMHWSALADVVVLKNTFQAGVGARGRLMSKCTRCGGWFVTTLRRMTPGGKLVRNVPQCVPCRGRYAKEKKLAAHRAAAEASRG